MAEFKQNNIEVQKKVYMTEEEVRELIAASLANWTGVTRFRTIETNLVTLSDFTDAQHDHSNAAGGGQIGNTALSEPVTVPNGGTGVATLTSGAYLKGNGAGNVTFSSTPLSGTKVYYVADTSGGAVTRKLTFSDGILTAET